MLKLENYIWRPSWTSHMGCLKAAADYLNVELSPAWLYGGTGHAFILNMHQDGCASGPTAWRTERIFGLANNLGLSIQGVWGTKSDKDFEIKKQRGYETIAYALERNLPCYGWELDIAEYYCITGCDETGFYYSGPTTAGTSKGPKPWRELGETQIAMLELYYVEQGYHTPDAIVVKEGLKFALEHALGSKWTFAAYKSGLAGYDSWLNAVQSHKPDLFGLAYNAAVWLECRHFAVEFLLEAKERLGTVQGLDEAIRQYQEVREQLAILRYLYPFPPDGKEPHQALAAQALSAAQSAESQALEALERVIEAI